MKQGFFLSLAAVVFALAFQTNSVSAPADPETLTTETGVTMFQTSDLQLTAGLRILYVSLLSSKRGQPFDGSFIGSINELSANQNYAPIRPYIQITMPIKMVRAGLGFGFDRMNVATMDPGGGDGDILSDIWTLYCTAAFPNSTRFTPFGEIGWSAYRNSFDPLPEWYDGGRREFVLDNSSALYLALGCDIKIAEGLSVNLYARYVDVDIDGIYIFRGDARDPKPFTFTLEHIAYGVGAQYTF